jgi:hypothetical protein
MLSEINIDQNGQMKIVTFNGIEALFGQIDNPAYSVLALERSTNYTAYQKYERCHHRYAL